MVASALCTYDRFRAVADQMELLIFAQTKPGTREVEMGTWHRFKLHDVAVEGAAFIDVGDVECDMI